MALGVLKNTRKVPLGFQSRLPSVGFFRCSSASSAAQDTTSVEDTEQVGGDLIDGTVTVDPEEEASLVVPRGQR